MRTTSILTTRTALAEMARQKLLEELSDEEAEYADVGGGYDALVRKAREALASLNDTEEGWQPIETAPRDGTRMLLWVRGHLVMLGSWAGHGAYSGAAFWSNNVPIVPQPTHWLPLPQPPAQAETAP